MATSKLAALRARIKAKEDAERSKLNERIAGQNAEWQEKETREQEERRLVMLKRRAEKAIEEEAAAAKKLKEEEAAAAKKIKDEQNAMKTPSKGAPASEVPVSSRTCRCGLPVVQKMVQKEGPNHGRAFIACVAGKKEFGGCNFFEWLPLEDPNAPTPPTPESANAQSVDMKPPSAGSPSCKCGVEAMSFEVRKEGPNQGRRFWKCKERQCAFFEWEAVSATGG
jgi:hypothetical protein